MFNIPIGGLSSNFFNISNLDIANASITKLTAGEVDAVIFNTHTTNTSQINSSSISVINASFTNVSLTNLSSNKITTSNFNNNGHLNSSFGNIHTLTADTFNANYIQAPLIYSDEIIVFGDITANNLTTANLSAGQNISIVGNVISAVSTVPNDLTLNGVSAQQSGAGAFYQKYLTFGGNRIVQMGKDTTGDSFNIYTTGSGNPDPDTHFTLNRTGGTFNASIVGTLTCSGNLSAPNFQPKLNFTYPLAKTPLNEVLVNNTNVVTAGSTFLVTSGAVHNAISAISTTGNTNIVQTRMYQGTTLDPVTCDGGVTMVNTTIAPSANVLTAFHVDFTPKFANSFIHVTANYSYGVTGNGADEINFILETVRNNNTAPLLIIDFVAQKWDTGGGGGGRSASAGSQSGCYQNNDTVGKFHRLRLRVGNITGNSNDTVTINNTYAITVTVTEVLEALVTTNLSINSLQSQTIGTPYLNASLIRINDNQHPAELQGSSDNHAIVFREDVEGTAFREISYFRFLNGGLRASQTEKMRIQQNGNVGINTDSPTEKLHVVGNIRATGNVSTQFVFCDLIVANNLRTADLNAGTNISILNGSISAFLNLSNISVTNVSCRNIGSDISHALFIKRGSIAFITIGLDNLTTFSNNVKMLGDDHILGNLSCDGIAIFNNVSAANLSTAKMNLGAGLSFIDNTLSIGSFAGTDITCSDLIADNNVSINGTLKVANVANFGADVNMSDQLYIGDPGIRSGRLIIYDQIVGNTLKTFYDNGKCITDIEATSINYTKDNISKIEIADDFNVYSDMYVFGKVVATDGIDLTNLSLINVQTLNASTINISNFNIDILNISTLNTNTMNASTNNTQTINSSTLNADKINVSNLSVQTKATIVNLSNTNMTVSNQLTVNKQTNSGKAVFNGLVDINNLATIQDVYATGTIFCDNDGGFNSLDVTTTIGCNTLNATKVNVPNLSVTTKATIQNLSVTNAINASTIVANQIDIPKINVTNLSVTTKATIQNLSVTNAINASIIVANQIDIPKINVTNLSVTTKATIQNLSVTNGINASILSTNQLDATKINNTNLSNTGVATFSLLRGVTLEGNTINASNISSKGDIRGNYINGSFVEGFNSFFGRLETDDLVLNNPLSLSKINVSNLSVNQSVTIGGNLQLLGQVNGTLRASQNLSAQNVYATQLVQSPSIDGTTIITSPLITGATIEGTTIVTTGIGGINNGIVLLNGQANQTNTNQWVNVSNFRSTFARIVDTDPTNYIVRIGATDRMTIGNSSTRFNTSVIVDGVIISTNNISAVNISVATLNGTTCTIPNYTASTINMTRINLSNLSGGGVEGRIQGFDANNAIVMRESGFGNMAFYTPLEHRFWTNTALTPFQRMVIRQNGNVGINTTTPTKLLDVNGNAIIQGGLEILTTNTVVNCLQLEEVNSTNLTVALRKARGIVGARTAVQTNDRILEMAGQGYFGFEGIGGDFAPASAKMEMIANQPFTPAAHGTYISFSTTENNTTTCEEHLRIESNGNLQVVGNKNILSGRFRCLRLIDNLNNRFPTAGSGNSVNLINPLVVNGGTLHFDFQCGGYSNTATSVGYRFELRNLANNTTIDSTTALFFFNNTGVHQFWSRTDVYTGVSAGSYILRVVRLNTALIHDANDYFNITMTEYPF